MAFSSSMPDADMKDILARDSATGRLLELSARRLCLSSRTFC